MPYQRWLQANFGKEYQGVATFGYQLLNPATGGAMPPPYDQRITAGVTNAGEGQVRAYVTLPDTAVLVRWTPAPAATSYLDEVVEPAIAGAAGDAAAIAAAVWVNTPRTLTQQAGPAAVGGSGGLAAAAGLVIIRGDTLALSMNGLPDLTAATDLWVTVKRRASDPDAAAILQWRMTVGLVRLNGKPATPTDGSLAVIPPATGGAILLGLLPVASAQLCPASYEYDVQQLAGAAITTIGAGPVTVTPDWDSSYQLTSNNRTAEAFAARGGSEMGTGENGTVELLPMDAEQAEMYEVALQLLQAEQEELPEGALGAGLPVPAAWLINILRQTLTTTLAPKIESELVRARVRVEVPAGGGATLTKGKEILGGKADARKGEWQVVYRLLGPATED